MRWLDGIIKSMDMSLSKVWKLVKDREVCVLGPWGRKDSDMTEQLRAALLPRKKTAWSWLRKLPIMFHFYLFLLFFPCEVTRWSSHTVNQHHVLVDYSVFFNLEILSNWDSAKEIAIKTGNYIKKKKSQRLWNLKQ